MKEKSEKRRIRFRVWDDICSYMFYPEQAKYCVSMIGTVCDDETGDGTGDGGILENRDYRSTAMLSTGLKDKNGKEIYEGDILEYKPCKTVSSSGFYLIRWASTEEDECGFVCDRRKPNYNYMLSTVWRKMKVVGNIYENPELLKET